MNAEQSSASLLAKFRSDRKHPPLHPLEKAVLTVVALHLCFLPWALGAMHAWSQLASLSLSLFAFVLALIPRTYSGDYAFPIVGDRLPVAGLRPPSSGHRPPSSAFRLTMWPRLFHFPIFWIGAALLGYVALQASNPSWVWERNETTWWLRRVTDIPWLPTSVDSPFGRFDIWRQFIIYASAWLTVCTVWTGFTRRRALQFLVTALVVNAVTLACVGFLQKFAGLDSYLLLMKWPEGNTAFASFIYRNHAGPYFALLTFLSLALAGWTSSQGDRAGRKSTPAAILVFVAVFLTAAVFFSLSRGASLILSGAWAGGGLWFWLYRRREPARHAANPVVAVVVTLLFVTVVGGTIRYLDFSSVEIRFHSLFTNYLSPDESVEARLLSRASAETMLGDYWQRGVGAGGFRYLYPEYIRDKPAIYSGGRLFWEHAHCDWLEIPIELGATGTLLLLLGGAYWLRFFYRHRALWHPLAAPLLLGCGQTLAHALFDFPFQNPAILCTWLALIAVSARWLELDTV